MANPGDYKFSQLNPSGNAWPDRISAGGPGGIGSGTSNQRTITQAAHGFVAKDAVYDNAGTWVKAKADDIATARVSGVVESSASANTFVVVLGGAFAATGWAANTQYYLSAVTAGLLTNVAPTAETHYEVAVVRTGAAADAIVEIDEPLSLVMVPNEALADDAKRPAQVAPAEIAVGTGTPLRSWSAADILSMILTHAGVSNPDATKPVVSGSPTINAAGTQLTVPMSEIVTSALTGTAGFTLTASGGAVTLVYLSGGDTLRFTFSAARIIQSGETTSLAYAVPGSGAVVQDTTGNRLDAFTALTTINNSNVGGADTTAPQVNGEPTVDVTGLLLTIPISEIAICATSGNAGFTLAASGGPVFISYSSGSGTGAFVFSLSRTILFQEDLTLDYDVPVSVQVVADFPAGNNMVAFPFPIIVDNYSTQTTAATNNVDMLLTFEAGTIGNLVTIANLETATIGQTGNWQLVYEDLGHTRIVANSAIRRSGLVCNGTTYDGTGHTRAIEFDMTEAIDTSQGLDAFKWVPPGGLTNITVTAMMKFNAIGSASGNMAVDHIRIDAGGFFVLQQYITTAQFGDNNNTAGFLAAHGQVIGGASSFGGGIPIVRDTLYSVTLRENATAGFCEVICLDGVTGALVGSSRCVSNIAGQVSGIYFQDYLVFYGGETLFDLIAFDWTNAAFPLEPFSVATAPTALAVAQHEVGRLDINWLGLAFQYKLERNAAGAGWTTLVAAQEHFSNGGSYADTSVINGVNYEYRVSSIIGAVVSAPTAVVALTVNDAAFAETAFVWQFYGGVTAGLVSGSEAGFRYVNGPDEITVTQLGVRRGTTANTFANHDVKVFGDNGTTVLASATAPMTTVGAGEIAWVAITPLVIPANAVRHFRVVVTSSYNHFIFSSNINSYYRTSAGTISAVSNAAGVATDGYGADVNFKYEAIGGAPPAGPSLTSAIINSAGTSITFGFSEAVSLNSGVDNDFILNPTGADVTLTYASGDGTASRVYTISRPILQTSEETAVLGYDQPGNGVEATAGGTDLATFSGMAVTNNSTQSAIGAPTPGILWWKMNDGTGVDIDADVGVAGATTNAWTTATQSGTGAALVFIGEANGADWAVSVSAVAYVSPTAITISFWTKRNNNAATQILVESGSLWTSNAPAFVLYMTSGVLNAAMVDSGGGIRSEYVAIGSGSWLHVAVVLDHAANSGAGDVKIYLGGTLQTTTIGTNTKTVASTFANQVLNVGARSGGLYGYDGNVDDVQIHTGELSAGQIAAIAAAGSA